MAKVRVGLIGCGFAAELHMYAYQRLYGANNGCRFKRRPGGRDEPTTP